MTNLDEDIPTVDTTVASTATLPHVPQFQGPLTRAHARQLNYQVLSDMGWPDLLSKLAVVMMMMIDNLVSPMISPR
jgi:hypothetical protein